MKEFLERMARRLRRGVVAQVSGGVIVVALLIGPLAAQLPSTGNMEFLDLRKLDFQLSCYRRALGDPMNKAGQQRLALAGEITDERTGRKESLQALRDLPSRSRFARAGHAFGHDKNGKWNQSANGNPDDDEILDMVHEDAIETFLYAQSQSRRVRLLGSRFRLAAQSASPRFLDIYSLNEDVIQGGKRVDQLAKSYRIDSNTLLLDTVAYERTIAGKKISVETRYEWAKLNGQLLPIRITRKENQQATKTIRWATAQLGERRDDGATDAPSGAYRP